MRRRVAFDRPHITT
jgi:hypothetical protein